MLNEKKSPLRAVFFGIIQGMKLLIFPGNSLANKVWADGAYLAFAGEFSQRYRHYYSHWESGEPLINFETELAKLASQIKPDEECVVLAKSAGSLLALMAIGRGMFKAKKCVFVGLPLKLVREENVRLEQALTSYTLPTIIIQNLNDPVATFEEVKNYLAQLGKPNFTILATPAADHKYLDFDLIKQKIGGFYNL